MIKIEENKNGSRLHLVNSFSSDSNNIQENLVLSMLHVSFNTKIYKEWLYHTLLFLYNNCNNELGLIRGDMYFKKLEIIANKLYLKQVEKDGFPEKSGTSTPHYLFNYIDFLLWKEKDNAIKKFTKIVELYIELKSFSFSTSRNSVEHYLAKNLENRTSANNFENKVSNIDCLDNLGNLCLISNNQNSALSDATPKEKRERYLRKNINNKNYLKCHSLKQALMFSYENWNYCTIKEHYEEIKLLLTTVK